MEQGPAGHGVAWQGRARNMAWLGRARRGMARHGRAWQGEEQGRKADSME